MFNSKLIHMIALCLAIVGALNWGLVGLFDVNLITKLFGTMPILAKIIYALIGLSGISLLISAFTDKTLCNR
jgi:uncharacterized protein